MGATKTWLHRDHLQSILAAAACAALLNQPCLPELGLDPYIAIV